MVFSTSFGIIGVGEEILGMFTGQNGQVFHSAITYTCTLFHLFGIRISASHELKLKACFKVVRNIPGSAFAQTLFEGS